MMDIKEDFNLLLCVQMIERATRLDIDADDKHVIRFFCQCVDVAISQFIIPWAVACSSEFDLNLVITCS